MQWVSICKGNKSWTAASTFTTAFGLCHIKLFLQSVPNPRTTTKEMLDANIHLACCIVEDYSIVPKRKHAHLNLQYVCVCVCVWERERERFQCKIRVSLCPFINLLSIKDIRNAMHFRSENIKLKGADDKITK